MTEVKIMVQTPGLVLFDPVVLQGFIESHNVPLPNVLESFIDDPAMGNKAISGGYLLPIYSIPAWDYRVLITEDDKPTVPPEWVLFTTPPFVLQVAGQRLVISDIWAILNWEADTYLQFGNHPVDEKYAAANEFTGSAVVMVPNGRYQVTIVGFCDTQNPDVENRKCGYEFLLQHNDEAVFAVVGSIDNLDLNVVGLPK